MKDKMTAVRRGRPREELTKSERVNLRMNIGEKAMLDILAAKLGVSRTDAVLMAVKKMYKDAQK